MSFFNSNIVYIFCEFLKDKVVSIIFIFLNFPIKINKSE